MKLILPLFLVIQGFSIAAMPIGMGESYRNKPPFFNPAFYTHHNYSAKTECPHEKTVQSGEKNVNETGRSA